MIDIYSEEYAEKELNPIFNGGVAGVVKGCTAWVEKKTDKDPDNFPKYRVVYKDENGGEINKGYFDNVDDASDKAKAYFVKEMKHLLNESGTKITAKPTSYSDLLDVTMKELFKAMPKNKYNLAVSFGTKSYPKLFLEINGYWGVMNVESSRTPNTPKDALMEKPAQDKDDSVDSSLLEGGKTGVTEDEVDW